MQSRRQAALQHLEPYMVPRRLLPSPTNMPPKWPPAEMTSSPSFTKPLPSLSITACIGLGLLVLSCGPTLPHCSTGDCLLHRQFCGTECEHQLLLLTQMATTLCCNVDSLRVTGCSRLLQHHHAIQQISALQGGIIAQCLTRSKCLKLCLGLDSFSTPYSMLHSHIAI